MPQALITNTNPGTPKVLATTTTEFRTLLLIACKSLAGPTAAPNTGTVYIGNSAAADEQPLEMSPGSERSFDAADGKRESLQKWYLDVDTSGDGVVAIWF